MHPTTSASRQIIYEIYEPAPLDAAELADLRASIADPCIPRAYRGCSFANTPAAMDRAIVDDVRFWAHGPSAEDARAAWRKGGLGRKYCLFIGGPVGVGKTGLAVSAQRGLIRAYESREPFFVTAGEIIDNLKERMSNRAVDSLLQRAYDADTLVLDDLGVERSTEWSTDRLYSLLDERFRSAGAWNVENDTVKRTIITSNFKVSELADRIASGYKSPTERRLFADRIGRRLGEMCKRIYFPDDAPNLTILQEQARRDTTPVVAQPGKKRV